MATDELCPSALPSEPSLSPARLSIVTLSMTSFDLLPTEKTWRGELMILRLRITPDMVTRMNCEGGRCSRGELWVFSEQRSQRRTLALSVPPLLP